MKTLKQFNEAVQAAKIKVQDDSVNYLSKAELEKYLEVAKAFLSENTRNIIKYLIDNNTKYISELSNDKEENALAGFYNYGKASTEEQKNLKTWIKEVDNSGRLLEIPVFQTKEQFEAIMNKKVAPDEIILDLKSEKGKNAVIAKYTPLIHKICKQFLGKSNLEYDDLVSIAYEAMAIAIKDYGQIRKKKTDDQEAAIKGYTFGQFAAYAIRNLILDNIKNFSHTVRIPISQQQKEKKETGRNTKSNTVSGNKAVGHDDEGNKSLFDFMADTSDASSGLDQEDMKRLWKEIFTELEDEFEPKIIDMFYSFYGLNGHKQLQNKKLAEKYKIKPSQVTYYCFRVRNYIMTNKKILDKFKDVYELMKECQNDADRMNNDGEPMYIHIIKNISIEE